MADVSVVMEKLRSFETPNDLAEFFQGYGIKARPRNARMCPITKFVMEETRLRLQHVATYVEHLAVYNCQESELEEAYAHSGAMIDFIEMYDAGQFPSLIEEGYEWQRRLD